MSDQGITPAPASGGKCQAMTKAGTPCRARPLHGHPYCIMHSSPEMASELGRRRKPVVRRNYWSDLGRKGGRQRAMNLTPYERKEAARHAANERWRRYLTLEKRQAATWKARAAGLRGVVIRHLKENCQEVLAQLGEVKSSKAKTCP